MFCLHFCYLPRINHCIESFQEAWNNHCLSTEGNATPQQLFLAGLLVAGQVPEVPGPSSANIPMLPESNDHVAVPRSRFLPCSALECQLRSFNPLSCTDYFDDGIFVLLQSFVGHHLLSGCQHCTE